MANNEKVQFYGTGRRKSSVARVRLVPGNGQIIVNGKDSKDYFCKKTLEMIIRQPLVLTETEGRFDVLVNAHGGGTTGQAGAVRLGIARALLKKPKILILDDSTSAVDTKTDASIRRAFREEIPNTTKIIIAQRISSVEDADKIIVMDNGEINGIGTHEELLKNNEIYKEVYNSQVKGGGDDE